MKRLILSITAAGLTALLLAASVLAAGPGWRAGIQAGADDPVAGILGLSPAEITELRQDGLSLAQIAERHDVDPQQLVDALVTRWAERIEVRVQNGALTAEEAAQLRTQLETQARNMVYRTTLGGMQGAAVGAGPQAADGAQAGRGAGVQAGNGPSGQRHGAGLADGSCTGQNGAGRR
jgi:DNA-binding transcriptional MerR regulator